MKPIGMVLEDCEKAILTGILPPLTEFRFAAAAPESGTLSHHREACHSPYKDVHIEVHLLIILLEVNVIKDTSTTTKCQDCAMKVLTVGRSFPEYL